MRTASPEASPGTGAGSTPTAALDQQYAEVLAEVLGVAKVAVDAHFFDDLGADSMRMAQFCARVRKRPELRPVSMKEIYQYPTLAALAEFLAAPASHPPHEAPALPQSSVPDETASPPAVPVRVSTPIRRAGRVSFLACAVAQLTVVLFPAFAAGFIGVLGYRWVEPATGAVASYLRVVEFLAVLALAGFLLPIVAKWVLIGRWKEEQFAVWTPRYFRFWLVKSMVARNPLVPLMVGSPLLTLYLRLLGARIGRGTTMLTRQFPVCTDLFTVGAGTVIRKDAVLVGYHVENQVVRTGRVAIGDRAVVGENSVLEIGTAVGDDAHLGHASSLHPGQAVLAGERWHGSPAVPGAPGCTTVEPARIGTGRRVRFAAAQLALHVLVTLPLTTGIGLAMVWATRYLVGIRTWGEASLADPGFLLGALRASAVLFFGAAVLGLPLMFAIVRAFTRALRTDHVYRLFGFHHLAARGLTAFANRKFYLHLFGDSSAIVRYLKRLGYRMSPYVQTGTNFGTSVKHDSPAHVVVGMGTVVADGLSTLSAEFSATTFRLRPVRIGRNNFLGNNVVYPPDGRTGDNCLLATKVMVPIDGEVRTGVGLLGSPPFEIPRTVARDAAFAVEDPAAVRRALRAKNRHNTVTGALQLLNRWFFVFLLLLYTEVAAEAYRWAGGREPFPGAQFAVLGATGAAMFLLTIGYWVLVARSVNGLIALAPDGVSVYDRAFWRHERHWKVPAQNVLRAFAGTPFQPWIWRGVGARVGRNLFDDGANLVERPLVSLGDDVTLNAGALVQGHSQEDGGFKSDRIRIGNGVTVGVGAWVHYGTTLGDGTVLAADSFLMKGEELEPYTYWGGNPARELTSHQTRAEFHA